MSGALLTVDVVVLAGSEPAAVLLVRRRNDPFAGAWALPGGFVEAGERVQAAARRELAEETGVIADDSPLELLGVYDTPGRDPRGLTISIVHVLRSAERLAARAGDDAGAVGWFEVDALPPLAFDHALVLADALSYAARGRRT